MFRHTPSSSADPAVASSLREPPAAARPKFSRRPARFADAVEVASVNDVAPPPPAVTSRLEPVAAWQEDLPFGVALLVILLLLNLALLYAIPARPEMAATETSDETSALTNALPSPTHSESQAVTSYAPADRAAESDWRGNGANQAPLATASDQFPPPVAKPLREGALPSADARTATDEQ